MLTFIQGSVVERVQQITLGSGITLTQDTDGLATIDVTGSLTQAAADLRYLQLTGGTLTGTLLIDKAATTANSPSTYHSRILVSGADRLTFGADTSFAYIQSWGSQPLKINSQGNGVIIGTNGLSLDNLTPVAGWYLASNTKGLLIQNSAGSNKIAVTINATNGMEIGDGLPVLMAGPYFRVTASDGWAIGSVTSIPRIVYGVALANHFSLITGGNADAGLYLGKLQTPVSTTDSQAKIGTIEIQGYGLNNAWVGENVYFDGSNMRYRATGVAGYVYFDATSIVMGRAVSGSAGAIAPVLTAARFEAARSIIYGALIAGSFAGSTPNPGDVVSRRSATTGVYYFGDANTKYFYYDGTTFNLVGGPFLSSGSVNTSAQLRATGWWASGDSVGLGAELGVSAGQVYLYAYNRSTSAYAIMNFGATAYNFAAGSLTLANGNVLAHDFVIN